MPITGGLLAEQLSQRPPQLAGPNPPTLVDAVAALEDSVHNTYATATKILNNVCGDWREQATPARPKESAAAYTHQLKALDAVLREALEKLRLLENVLDRQLAGRPII